MGVSGPILSLPPFLPPYLFDPQMQLEGLVKHRQFSNGVWDGARAANAFIGIYSAENVSLYRICFISIKRNLKIDANVVLSEYV